MIEVYNPTQAEVLFKYVEHPKWFVLGGTGYGIECQCVRKHWPDVEILACEPIPETRSWQIHEQAFPVPDRLLPFALWDEPGTIRMMLKGQQSSAARPGMFDGNGESIPVEATTLDILDARFGPFEDAVLWLDVEHAEYKALLGGRCLMQSGRVKVLNIEYMETSTTIQTAVDLLEGWGYRLAEKHQVHQNHHDRIYVYASV